MHYILGYIVARLLTAAIFFGVLFYGGYKLLNGASGAVSSLKSRIAGISLPSLPGASPPQQAPLDPASFSARTWQKHQNPPDTIAEAFKSYYPDERRNLAVDRNHKK